MRSGLHGLRSGLCAGFVVLGLSALMLTLGGCGSSKGSAPAPTYEQASIVTSVPNTPSYRGTGRARFTLFWPASQTTAERVVITVWQRKQILVGETRVLTRPTSNGSADISTDAVWDALPLGDATVRADAYATDEGTSTPTVPLSQAAAVIAIEDSATKSIRASLGGAVDHLQISTGALTAATRGNPATVFKSDELPLAVCAMDSQNRVLFSNEARFEWTSSDAANAPVQGLAPSDTAMLTAQDPTVATVSVKLRQTGKIAFVQIPVSAFSLIPVQGAPNIINNDGWILGFNELQKPPYTDFAKIIPSQGNARSYVYVAAINNVNQVVGIQGTQDPTLPNGATLMNPMPFIWQESTGPVLVRTTSNYAILGISDLNDEGQILFYPDVPHETSYVNDRAFLAVNGGAATLLPKAVAENGETSLLTYTRLTNGGHILAFAPFRNSPISYDRAVFFSSATSAPQLILPLPEGYSTRANAGNVEGIVVGQASGKTGIVGENPNIFHATFWTPTSGTFALPSLTNTTISNAEAINVQGNIAGTATIAGKQTAILWRNHQPRDLNQMLTLPKPGAPLVRAIAISDQNRIIVHDGYGASVLVPVTGKQDQ